MGTIVGMVTDRQSGAVLQIVKVETDKGQSVTTGKIDRFTLGGVPSGEVLVKASKRGYETSEKTVTMTDGETKTVNFALRPRESEWLGKILDAVMFWSGSGAGSHPGGWWETVKTVVYAVAIALVIRTFAYEPFNIPSGSMVPTLLVGDYLFVSKLSYGYSRYSLPFSLPLIPGRIFQSEPERGDVAVFKLPTDDSKDYIKRIIGLPGDRIQMRGGRLYINGTIVPRRRVEDYLFVPEFTNRLVAVPQYEETLPNGLTHRILESNADSGPLDTTHAYIVPKGHYFAMGDNRDNSLDSRTTQVGFIPAQNLVGRADLIFFSVGEGAAIWEVWRWPSTIRFSRLISGVE